MSTEQKLQGDFWDAVRVECAKKTEVRTLERLTMAGDNWSKDGARCLALGAFLHRDTEHVYIQSRATSEKIDLTAEMRKVEAEFERRRDREAARRRGDGRARFRPPRPGELEEIIRAVLPEEG